MKQTRAWVVVCVRVMSVLVFSLTLFHFTICTSTQFLREVSQSVCLSVSLSVRSRISKTTRANFIKCSVPVYCGLGWLGLPLQFTVYFRCAGNTVEENSHMHCEVPQYLAIINK